MNENQQGLSPVKPINYQSAANELKAHLKESPGSNIHTDLGSVLSPGTESRSAEATAVFDSLASEGEATGRSVLGPDVWGSLTAAQKEAFRITSTAWADIAGYNRAATTINVSNESRVPTFAGDSYLTAEKIELTTGNEAYDHRNLLHAKVATTIVNVGSARQDDFAEAFFPTVVLPPDQGNVRLSVDNTFVMTDYLHTGDGLGGVPYGFGGVGLVDVLVNPEVLRDHSTHIVPVWSNTSEIFNKDVASFEMYNIETGALKFNTDIGLLAANMDSILNPTHVPDATDQLDHKVGLESIFLKISDGTDTEILRINLLDVVGANFVPSNGKTAARDLVLNFTTKTLPIHGNLKTVAGAESKVLKYLRDNPRENWVVNLDVAISGNVNLETGSIRVNATPVQIASVWDCPPKENGLKDTNQIIDSGELNALNAKLTTIELIGWFPDARRTNFNRRTRGILVRQDVLSEVFTIPMGPPVSALTPVVDTETLVDLEGPIKVNRIRNSQNALRTLLDYGNMLSRHVNTDNFLYPRPDIQGIGRYIIRPYYAEQELDLTKAVDSLTSTGRLDDLNSAVVNAIRAMVTIAWSVSNYGPAWDAMSMEGKVKVNIGTNSVIGQFLDILGDNRTLGNAFKGDIVTTNNREIGDWIIINFTTNTDKVVFNSGNFYYIPEIVSTLPKTTNGGQSVQLTVQNRNMHLCHCPIQLRLKLTGLTDILTKKVPIHTHDV